MVQINFARKEVNCKIIFYGPGMSGKTTNLEKIYENAPEENKGELTSIATEGDRTLFFDLLPLDLGMVAGLRVKLQLYTVPGQVYYSSTRRLVLAGADGVAFVADSQPSKRDENLESLEDLTSALGSYGTSIDKTPTVLQYNKRDLPGAMSVAQMDQDLNHWRLARQEAVAVRGEGVLPTLKAMIGMVLTDLQKRFG